MYRQQKNTQNTRDVRLKSNIMSEGLTVTYP